MSEKHMAAEVNRLGSLVGDLQRENGELRKSISDVTSEREAALTTAHRYYRIAGETVDLLDRAIKIFEQAVPPAVLHDAGANNPIVAWLAAARETVARERVIDREAVE